MRGEMNRRTPLAFFSICAVVDFVFGLVKWHSVVAGIVAIVLRLSVDGLAFSSLRGVVEGQRRLWCVRHLETRPPMVDVISL
jgi:hypothetical protein